MHLIENNFKLLNLMKPFTKIFNIKLKKIKKKSLKQKLYPYFLSQWFLNSGAHTNSQYGKLC